MSAVNFEGWWTGDDYGSWPLGLVSLVVGIACLGTGIGFARYGVSGSGGNPEDYAGGGDG
ncbi:MAG: hypothetical protein GY772_22645 [bacterium]|nr:hypothetical protein [bacterium]